MQNQSKKTELTVTKSEKRDAAKAAITLSIGALTATGLMKGRGAKVLHLWSGIALMGFTYWHYSLYQPNAKHKQPGR
jgi:hypothetical protein